MCGKVSSMEASLPEAHADEFRDLTPARDGECLGLVRIHMIELDAPAKLRNLCVLLLFIACSPVSHREQNISTMRGPGADFIPTDSERG